MALGSPLTAVAGLNGVGKTTLLWATYACLKGAVSACPARFGKRLVSGDLSVAFEWRGTSCTAQLDLSSGSHHVDAGDHTQNFADAFEVVLLDVGECIPRVQHAFGEEANLAELLEALESSQLSTDELKKVNYLVGRTYDRVDVFELEGFAGEARVPYFQVTFSGATYGVESMGSGEFAALYLHWSCEGLREGSVVLIEEPESFVSPRSQAAVLDVLVAAVVRSKSSFLLTTHSPDICSRLSGDAVRVMFCDQGSARLAAKPDAENHLRELGHNRGVRLIVLVEDRAAHAIVTWLMRAYLPDLVAVSDVLWCGSDDDVLDAERRLPHQHARFDVVAFVDGDMRDKWKDDPEVRYLPGIDPPDLLLRRAVESESQAFADALGVELEELKLALAELAGVDFHDWLLELARRFGMATSDVVCDQAVRIWHDQDGVGKDCAEWCEALRVAYHRES